MVELNPTSSLRQALPEISELQDQPLYEENVFVDKLDKTPLVMFSHDSTAFSFTQAHPEVADFHDTDLVQSICTDRFDSN